jgi:MFS family permease
VSREVSVDAEETGPLAIVRQFLGLERDVLVLSLAMFAFSVGFQATSRFLPEYLVALGASGVVVGLYRTLGNVIGAVYPYPGGAISDRIGSRYALTLFGLVSTAGFVVWLVAPSVGVVTVGGVQLEPWVWIFVGLLLAQAWKSFGLGATFAVVKQATAPGELASGFASTETFRRSAFFLGPVLAAVLLDLGTGFTDGFQSVLALAAVFGGVGTLVQHVLYDASEDTLGETFAGLEQIRRDLRGLPTPLRPLLVADTLVRFANGMVYAFFVLVVTRVYEVGFAASVAVGGQTYSVAASPPAFFGYLLGVEMLVALGTMVPAAKLAERVGLKPVVAFGFAVYAVFPVALIGVPELAGVSQWVFVGLFALSGLRFAGLPSHKALIVGPAKAGAGGRVTGSYYLLRNTLVIPSAALGGVLWEFVSPQAAFGLASLVGVCGVGYFVAFGEEFEPYR